MPNIEITVIDYDPQDRSLMVARRTYPNHILASSVWSMVDGVLTVLRQANGSTSDPALIGLLRIVGHGAPGVQALGNSRTTQNPRQLIALDSRGHLLNQATLLQLRGRFTQNAVVEMHGCHTGLRGEGLLRALKNIWGVTVRAGRVNQDLATPGWEYLEH